MERHCWSIFLIQKYLKCRDEQRNPQTGSISLCDYTVLHIFEEHNTTFESWKHVSVTMASYWCQMPKYLICVFKIKTMCHVLEMLISFLLLQSYFGLQCMLLLSCLPFVVQNHRRYVRSRDDLQLHGQLKGKVSSDCDPFGNVNSTPIAPCGAIANSLFNGKLMNILVVNNKRQ